MRFWLFVNQGLWLLLLFLIVLFLSGCVTRMAIDNPFLVVAVGDAYSKEYSDAQLAAMPAGDATAVAENGEPICPDCPRLEVRGARMGKNIASVIIGILKLGLGIVTKSASAALPVEGP
jgi:hypothetical protein